MNFYKSFQDLRRRGSERKAANSPNSLLIESPDTDLARASLWVASGAADDKRPGTAHFLEHILLDQVGHSLRSSSSALRINALTSWNWTAYTWAGPVEALRDFLFAGAGLLQGEALPAGIVAEHQRIIAMELLERRAAGKGEAEMAAIHKSAFPGSGLHGDVVGTLHHVKNMSQPDLEAFRGRHYKVENCFFLVSAPKRCLQNLQCNGKHGSNIQSDESLLHELARWQDFLPRPNFFSADRPSEASGNTFETSHLIYTAIEDKAEHYVVFACQGSKLGKAEAENVYAALRLFQDWLNRKTPGSLAFVFSDVDGTARELAVTCFLTRTGRAAVCGSFRTKTKENIEVTMAALETAFIKFCKVELTDDLMVKLRSRELNYFARQPLWSHERMMLLGDALSSYGPDAAFDHGGNVKTLRADKLASLLSSFQYVKRQRLDVTEGQYRD